MATADVFAPPLPIHANVPIFSAIARQWTEGRDNFPFYIILVLLLVWGGAVAMWGLPALALPAVALSAVMLLMLVLIGRG